MIRIALVLFFSLFLINCDEIKNKNASKKDNYFNENHIFRVHLCPHQWFYFFVNYKDKENKLHAINISIFLFKRDDNSFYSNIHFIYVNSNYKKTNIFKRIDNLKIKNIESGFIIKSAITKNNQNRIFYFDKTDKYFYLKTNLFDNKNNEILTNIHFKAKKQLVFHNFNSNLHINNDFRMRYVSYTRLDVKGFLKLNNKKTDISSSFGWIDYQWGEVYPNRINWVCFLLQTKDNEEYFFYSVNNKDGEIIKYGFHYDNNDNIHHYSGDIVDYRDTSDKNEKSWNMIVNKNNKTKLNIDICEILKDPNINFFTSEISKYYEGFVQFYTLGKPPIKQCGYGFVELWR